MSTIMHERAASASQSPIVTAVSGAVVADLSAEDLAAVVAAADEAARQALEDVAARAALFGGPRIQKDSHGVHRDADGVQHELVEGAGGSAFVAVPQSAAGVERQAVELVGALLDDGPATTHVFRQVLRGRAKQQSPASARRAALRLLWAAQWAPDNVLADLVCGLVEAETTDRAVVSASVLAGWRCTFDRSVTTWLRVPSLTRLRRARQMSEEFAVRYLEGLLAHGATEAEIAEDTRWIVRMLFPGRDVAMADIVESVAASAAGSSR